MHRFTAFLHRSEDFTFFTIDAKISPWCHYDNFSIKTAAARASYSGQSDSLSIFASLRHWDMHIHSYNYANFSKCSMIITVDKL